MLERNKKPIYYCKRYIENDMELFKQPMKRFLNFKSIGGEAILTTGGEVNTKDLVGKIYADQPQYFENDRCYVNKSPPMEFDPFCNDADYRVKAVLSARKVVEVVLERMV